MRPEILHRGCEGACRAGGQGHPPRDAQALLGRGEDPHRAGGPARRGEHRRAVPARGHRREPLLLAGPRSSWRPASGAWPATRLARRPPTRCKALRREARALKEVVAEQALENRLLKKSMTGAGDGRRMRYPASEKLEIIRLVEQSHLPVRRTLEQARHAAGHLLPLVRPLSGDGGPEALDDRPSRPDRVWNRIPDAVREPDHRPGAGRARAVAARAGRALHRPGALLRLRGLGLPPAQGARPDHQPGLHRGQGGRRVPRPRPLRRTSSGRPTSPT